jgi:hypothetical protein
MPSVLVELISGDMVESYRREAALDGKGGRGWSPAHTTPKSARGQTRQFGRASAMSGLALTADTETNALGWSLRGQKRPLNRI